MASNKVVSVDATIFNLTNESETIEGFSFQKDNVNIINPGEMIDKVDNDTILAFLNCPETKVFIKYDETGKQSTKMVAHNFISQETIEIGYIGDHIFAMNDTLMKAIDKRKELKSNPSCELLNHELIQNINAQLLSRRFTYGEVGIGEYRDVDLLGDPCNVMLASTDHGRLIPIKEWQPIRGGDKNVINHMNKLVDWVNSDNFKKMDPFLRAAIFHAKFIYIHPFRDGNGRTGRMLLNYMLITSGKKPTSITNVSHEEYFKANAEAIVNKNYQPLVNLIKSNQINYSRELYAAVVKHQKERARTINMKGHQIG
jgi:hypothetical protein